MFLYFQLAEDVVFQSISYEIYIDDVFNQDGALTTDGISELIEAPIDGSYVVYVTIALDTETSYTFTSNTLIVG